MVFIFLFVFIVVVGLTNTAVFKLAGKHRGRRLWSGLILILLSPIVFFITIAAIGPFDSGGFGKGLFAVLYGSVFFMNGLIMIMIGLFTAKSNKK